MSWTPAELMAIVVSRALRDGDVVVTGTNAAIPLSACRLAQRLGRPRVTCLIGATGTVDPAAELSPWSGADEAFLPGRLTTGLAAGLHDQIRGFADVIFLGALQIDRLGRCNLALLGDPGRPRLRGPGSIGLSLIATVKRAFLFFDAHDPRTFVEAVDFVSAEGLRAAGGIELIVTPLGVLGPDASGRAIDLRSRHPGTTFAEIQERTGFPLDPSARETPPPTGQELETLRSFPEGRRLGERRLRAP